MLRPPAALALLPLTLLSVPVLAAPPGGIDALSPLTYRAGPARVSDWIGGGTLIGGMGLQLGVGAVQGDWRGLGATSGALIVTGGLTEFTKVLTNRRRPYTYDPGHPGYGVQGYCRTAGPQRADDCKSFFSGHTALTASSAFSVVAAMERQSGTLSSRERMVAYSGATVLTLATASLRVVSGKHYVSDVAVGALVGTSLGLLVPQVVYRPR